MDQRPLNLVLAQASRAPGVILALLAVFFVVVGGTVVVMWIRRWLKEDDQPVKGGGIGFSLSDLRQLQKEGKITAEEYERARSKMVTAGKKAADELPDPLAGRRKPGQNRPGQSGAEGASGINPGGN